MGRPCIDLTGIKFGNLTAISMTGIDKRSNAIWACECQCGKVIRVAAAELRRGNPSNCGCLRKSFKKHGMWRTPEWNSWQAMKSRCRNPNNKDYRLYGGSGIKICEEWERSFESFYRDMGNRPQGSTLDRIDSAGDYTKENCRWSDALSQTKNRRTTVRVYHQGEVVTIKELAIITGIKLATLRWRLSHGRPLCA